MVLLNEINPAGSYESAGLYYYTETEDLGHGLKKLKVMSWSDVMHIPLEYISSVKPTKELIRPGEFLYVDPRAFEDFVIAECGVRSKRVSKNEVVIKFQDLITEAASHLDYKSISKSNPDINEDHLTLDIIQKYRPYGTPGPDQLYLSISNSYGSTLYSRYYFNPNNDSPSNPNQRLFLYNTHNDSYYYSDLSKLLAYHNRPKKKKDDSKKIEHISKKDTIDRIGEEIYAIHRTMFNRHLSKLFNQSPDSLVSKSPVLVERFHDFLKTNLKIKLDDYAEIQYLGRSYCSYSSEIQSKDLQNKRIYIPYIKDVKALGGVKKSIQHDIKQAKEILKNNILPKRHFIIKLWLPIAQKTIKLNYDANTQKDTSDTQKI